jgi:hypothetical protein
VLFTAIFFADEKGFENLYQHMAYFLNRCHIVKIQASLPNLLLSNCMTDWFIRTAAVTGSFG